MRKPIEDEIHDIMARQIMNNIDAQITSMLGVTAKQVPLNVKDIEHMLEEVEKLSKEPDLQYVFIATDGKVIEVERVINLRTATEEDIDKVFRNHPALGIDLTGAQVVSFEKPKLNWRPLAFSMDAWEPTTREAITKEEPDVEAT